MRARLILAAVLSIAAAGADAQTGRPLVNTSHVGAVTDLSGTSGGRFLASVGEDGFLRVWNLPEGSLQHAIAVGPGIPVAVRVSNAGDRVAVLVRRSVSEYRASIYSLPSESIVETITLSAGPTYFGLSRMDSLLILALPGFDSLRAYHMDTGEPAITTGFAGAITAVLTASNEQTFMTYRAGTGTLVYRDRQSGEVLAEARTLAFLNDLQPLPGRRVGIARVGDDLVGVDLVNGNLEFRRSIPGLQQHVVDEQSGRVITLSRQRGRNRIQIWDGSPGNTGSPVADSGDLDPLQVRVSFSGGDIYAGQRDGTIALIDPATGFPEPLVTSSIAPIRGIERSEERLLLAAGSQIISLVPQLQSDSARRRLESLDFGVLPLNTVQATGVQALEEDDLLVWSAEELRLVDLDGAEPDLLLNPGEQVRSTAASEDQLVVSSDRGTLSRFVIADLLELRRNPPAIPALPDIPRAVPTPPDADPDNPEASAAAAPGTEDSNPMPLILPTAEPDFSYSARGLQTAIPLDGGDILVAASRDRVLGTGLLRINPSTAETVPINHPGDVILALAQLSGSDSVFSLDSREASGLRQTVLSEIIGLEDRRSPTRIRRLAAVDGDWGSARLALDPIERVLYASMGDGTVLRRDLRRGSESSVSIVPPTDLAVFAGLLLALEPDGGVQMLSAEDLSPIGKLYAFPDGNWVLVSPSGYLVSESSVSERLVGSGSGGQRPAARQELQFPLIY